MFSKLQCLNLNFKAMANQNAPKPNDQRSNVKNENNPARKADKENRSNQSNPISQAGKQTGKPKR